MYTEILNQYHSKFHHRSHIHVQVGSTHSTPRRSSAGVPQGSPLSPILFNIYISDIPTHPNIHTALFADDTVIFAADQYLNTTRNLIQGHLTTIETWCKKWKIKINPSKSISKVFTLRFPAFPPPLKFDSTTIPWCSTTAPIRYLGVLMDTRLTWKDHVTSKVNEANRRLGILRPIINRHSTLKVHSALIIYKAILRPLLTYACPVWCNAAPTTINKIQIFQNKVLRIAVNAPWFISNANLHKDLAIEPVLTYITKLSHTFFQNLPSVAGASHFNLGKEHPIEPRLRNRLPFHIFLRNLADIR